MIEKQVLFAKFINALKENDKAEQAKIKKQLTNDELETLTDLVLFGEIKKKPLDSKARRNKARLKKFFLSGSRSEKIKSVERELNSWKDILAMHKLNVLPMSDNAISIIKYFIKELQEEVDALKEVNPQYNV